MINNLIYVLEWIIRIFGILSIIGLVFASLSPRKEYIANIMIKKIEKLEEMDNMGLHYYHYYEHENNQNSELYAIIPLGIDFKEVRFYEVDYDENKEELYEKEILEKYNNIVNYHAIVIKTVIPEGIPQLKVKWKTNNGMCGEHLFSYNGFNGNNDINCYKYKRTLIERIKILFGIS